MSFRNSVGQPKQFGQFISGLILCGALMWFCQLPVQAGQSVTLAWDQCSDPNVAGYKIYFGTSSHDYTQSVDVGNATNATITVGSAGTTYYFAATSYDSSGAESDFSAETTYTLPAAVTLTSAVCSGGQFSFTVTGTDGAQYVIEASTNLVDWLPVQTNTAPFTFVDANAAAASQCFYRSVSL